MNVTKRNGNIETYNVEKIHKVVDWAICGLNNVSLSEIEMNANLSLRDCISTKEIHQILIKSANDLTSPQNPNYQYVASRLLNMSLRKDLWDKYDCPPSLFDHVSKNIESEVYDNNLLQKWTKDDIEVIEKFIDHNRDYLFTYAGLQQLIDKYLVKNRATGKIYETPQFAYICIAMALFNSIDEVKEAYECFSTFKINLPTPIMAGVRTNIKQFASCVLVDVEDNLASIFSSVHAVGKYTARRAGIGLNIGRIRPINSSIRGGEVIHTGLIPYLKIFESTVKATSQNGIRGGSATVHVPFWHYEIEDIMVLKNNAGTDDNRVRKLDYSVQFNKLFYERLIKNEDITLFSPEETVGLYSSMNDNEDFKKLYEKYENSRYVKMKKKISARKLAEIFTKERLETGRIYVMNIDNANEHGSWDAPVYMSNLCLTGDTKIDAVIDGKKTLISLSELDDIFKAGKEIMVLSKNIDSSIISYERVLDSALTRENAELIQIEDIDSGFTIRCTPEHKIFTKNRGYVEAKNLEENDELDIIP
jgi:ribonucleoside-diphosphate reductase alpha chain